MNGITMWRPDPEKNGVELGRETHGKSLSNRKACTNRAKPTAHSQGKQWRSKGKNQLNVLKG
jgi:hypothetical protein